jgi:hypothetical protein
MTTTSKIASTLTGKFSDIIDFLTAAGADEADKLARRAVGIIVATDAPQTGEEVDTDPFVANMLASAALVSISESIKHYPFVSNSADFDQVAMLLGDTAGDGSTDVLASARELIERAETLLGIQPEPAAADPGAAALTALLDDAICRIFEETGQLPSAVLLVIIDDVEPVALAQPVAAGNDGAAFGEPVNDAGASSASTSAAS